MQYTLFNQIMALTVIGIVVSIIIYGLVALLVKIDDLGLYLIAKGQESIGAFLVRSMPVFMKGLGYVGTTAMFLVGGGIIAHTFHIPLWMPELLQHLVIGIVAGIVCLVPFEMYHQRRAH